MEEGLPQIEVSKPIEDICQYYYVFANCHCYLASHMSTMNTCTEFDDEGDEINVVHNLVVENNDAPSNRTMLLLRQMTKILV